MPQYDVIIVGARPAGAATALVLAQSGHRVLVVDRMRPGTDTLSTHALMRVAVDQLHRWDLTEQLAAAGTPAVSRVTFRYGDGVATPVDLREPLYAPRRTVLDSVVAAAAERAGAEFRYGVRVNKLLRDADGTVTGIRGTGPDMNDFTATATVTVGADGRRSLVAQQVGAPVTHRGGTFTSTIYGYFEGVETDGYEFLYGRQSAAGIIPTNDGAVNVFVGMRPERFLTGMRFDQDSAFRTVLAEVDPEAAARVLAGTQTERLRGFAGAAGHLLRPYGPGWALVGDAGYYKDPGTAHGLSDALRDAELLARALDDGLSGTREMADALGDYEATRDALSQRFSELTEAVAGLDWSFQQLRAIHLELSDEMKRETSFMADLPRTPALVS